MIDFFSMKGRALNRVGALFARHLRAAQIVRELGDSSDRALAEIGIARGDVGAVARGRFGRP